MSWVPPNLASACAVYTTITNCAPSNFLFLQLVAGLFGRAPENAQSPRGQGGFFKSFEQAASREYDFIVVGAGSAGCVVANRLSEVPEWTVLLLEAGMEQPEVVNVPGFAPLLQRSSVDWGTMTQPSTTSCTARRQGRCAWYHGRVMGGSSSMNYMVYMRGNPLDYDEWEQQGNPGWGYKNVFPYFLKSEDNQNLDWPGLNPTFHGQGGYQSVSLHAYQDQNIFPIINAFRELGLPAIDHNAGPQIGVSLAQGTVNNGRRVSTNDAFIRPIRNKRQNLAVETNANVLRVLINPQTKKAYGVEYYRNNVLQRVLARKEVIVSAGAIYSPKILMLSGIGPAEHLKSHGIQVLKNLPVGYNLHDHTTLDGVIMSIDKTSTIVDDTRRNADVYYYKESQRGPLSTSALLQINAMVQTKYAVDSRPEIQYQLDATNVANFYTDPILTDETNANPMAYYDGIMIRSVLLNPLSRGVILLNNSDPINGTPLVYANTFGEQLDLLRLVDGIKQSLRLVQTKSLTKLNYRLVQDALPACAHQPFGTDAYWACLATSYTNTIHHPVGTCKMGPKNDKTAVVDAQLRVHGIRNLRVVDASIMPVITRGNTNGPSIMIGERGSDFVKNTWLKGAGDQVEQPYEVFEVFEAGGHGNFELSF